MKKREPLGGYPPDRFEHISFRRPVSLTHSNGTWKDMKAKWKKWMQNGRKWMQHERNMRGNECTMKGDERTWKLESWISTTLGRTLRIMGIMWYTFVEASGLHRLVSNTTGGLQTQAFAACTCATTAPRLPRKSRGDLRCKIRSSVADLLIFKIQVKCGRRVAWGRTQNRNRRSPPMTISRRRRVIVHQLLVLRFLQAIVLH